MSRRARPLALLLALAAWPLLAAAGARAQVPLFLVDRATEVRSIGFRFAETRTFDEATLKEQISLTEQPALFGSVGLRRRLSWLPLVASVGVHPFSPIELQKDVVRLRRFYERNGFLQTEVDYLVRLDTTSNTVRVLFQVAEGPPLVLQSLDFLGPDGRQAFYQFPRAIGADWAAYRDDIALQTGRRLDDFAVVQLQDRALLWLKDRGYAFARVSAETAVDSTANTADVTLTVDAGPRARVDRIEVVGAESVSETVVRREIPLRRGDYFSASKLVEGQREVFGLNLFQLALTEVPQEQPVDSTVTVRVRVSEGEPRVVTAETGYVSEGGLLARGTWTHRNFLGGARTFTAQAQAQTGILGVRDAQGYRNIQYRAQLSLQQPYVGSRRFSLIGGPFAEYQNNNIDRSTTFGGDATLLFTLDTYKTLSLRYGFTSKNVAEPRLGSLGIDSTYTDFTFTEGLLQALRTRTGGFRFETSRLTLSGSWSTLDDPLSPRRGFVLRPSVQVTGPPAISAVEYGRFELASGVYLPLSRRVQLFGRLSAGHLLPFGGSVSRGAGAAAIEQYLVLRDAYFYGGGTVDVRGWADNLLGPKIPDVRLQRNRFTEEVVFRDGVLVDGYSPVGGTTRLSGTVELRLPFPGLGGNWGTHVFTDFGKVWTPRRAQSVVNVLLEEDTPLRDRAMEDERLLFSAGGGLQYQTPVGLIRLSAGYKLNPSFFDLHTAESVARTREFLLTVPGAPVPPDAPTLDDLRPDRSRLRFHLSIGQTF